MQAFKRVEEDGKLHTMDWGFAKVCRSGCKAVWGLGIVVSVYIKVMFLTEIHKFSISLSPSCSKPTLQPLQNSRRPVSHAASVTLRRWWDAGGPRSWRRSCSNSGVKMEGQTLVALSRWVAVVNCSTGLRPPCHVLQVTIIRRRRCSGS